MAGKRPDPSQNSGQGKADKNLASIAGVSHDTIHKAKIIAARATLKIWTISVKPADLAMSIFLDYKKEGGRRRI